MDPYEMGLVPIGPTMVWRPCIINQLQIMLQLLFWHAQIILNCELLKVSMCGVSASCRFCNELFMFPSFP